MNEIEAALAKNERMYTDGLLSSGAFCYAVIVCVAGKRSDEYDLIAALSPKAISCVVEEMNIMKAAATSGGSVISVDNSATVYDHTAQIPEFLAIADVWEKAEWIDLVTSDDNVEKWQLSLS